MTNWTLSFKNYLTLSTMAGVLSAACARLEDGGTLLDSNSRFTSAIGETGGATGMLPDGSSSSGGNFAQDIGNEIDDPSLDDTAATGGSGTGGSGTGGSSTGGSGTGGSSTGDDELTPCSVETDCASEDTCSQCLFGTDHGLPEVASYVCIELATQLDCGSGCVDTNIDVEHCGTCDKACEAGSSCVEGVCTCASGELECTDGCFDLTSDVNHCGECENACTAEAPFCVASSCQACDTPGEELCDATCVDTQVDEANCGECSNSCDSGEECIGGSCGCATAGEQACDGSCVDINTSDDHCGECGNACTGTDQCVSGQCYRANCVGVPSYSSSPFSGACNKAASRRIEAGKLAECCFYVDSGKPPRGEYLNSGACNSQGRPWRVVNVCAR